MLMTRVAEHIPINIYVTSVFIGCVLFYIKNVLRGVVQHVYLSYNLYSRHIGKVSQEVGQNAHHIICENFVYFHRRAIFNLTYLQYICVCRRSLHCSK